MEENIEIYGAREHNLKNIDLTLPRNSLVVITGISGSGKSSLAFDTLYAEGQRRYMESFSAYARSFMGNMQRPDVDKVNGLSPVISIEQKTTSRNPRSTVGTVTEIYDFMRLLYARAGDAFSYVTGERMVKQSEDQIIERIFEDYKDKRLLLLAPIIKGRKGHYRELFVKLRKSGFNKVRVDGEVRNIEPKMQLDRYKVHDIEAVIDRIVVLEKDKQRVRQSIRQALKEGKGVMMTLEPEANDSRFFSRNLMCPTSGIAYDDPAPNLFSFNSPYGMCKRCSGLGSIEEFVEEDLVPDPSMSISRGAIPPLGEYRDVWLFKIIEAILKKHKLSLSTPYKELPEEARHEILHGSNEEYAIPSKKYAGQDWHHTFEGLITYFQRQIDEGKNTKKIEELRHFQRVTVCPECSGGRLNKQALHFKIAGKNIAEVAAMDIGQLAEWFANIDDKLSEKQKIIGKEVLKEIKKRIGFLADIGLTYLTLNRPLRTLSGGEAQRIRLATQIGTQLVGVLYILDEPSIGLHSRDNERLIKALQQLRDLGNTVLVVEHDKDMMMAADHLVDIGPGAGRHGGRVVAAAPPKQFLEQGGTTADYLADKRKIEIPETRRKGKSESLKLLGAVGHNLKKVDLELPLGVFTCVTGVSGSGKSSLIHHTLYPILSAHFHRSKKTPLEYDKIEGLEHLDKVIEVDQSPIGRTPRSNPATYTGMFTDIRALFSSLPEAKVRGYKPGRFSFNVKGGRCETCEGAGKQTIEMEFLPDVLIECPTCRGRRYNRETLEIRYRSKSIADVLDMSVEEALEFFENYPKIRKKIQTLYDVGLGYITLGQHATTLSGGEAQRVKLATELARRDTGKTLYILDEPTTGLHFQDIAHLLGVLQRLVERGNSVLVIEHNMDVIKVADHIIDLGPEGGAAGGQIIAKGTPEQVAKNTKSLTGKFLALEL